MLLEPGTSVLDGRFRVRGPLASGGMGDVYLAEQVSLGRPVALKVLKPGMASKHGMSERFRQEAALLAQVEHPSVVRILDFGEHQGALCLVLERIDGVPLSSALKEGPLLPERVVSIVVQLLEGLAAIHARGIVHRDLMPKNIMLTQTPLGEKARLLDFGIARLLEPVDGDISAAAPLTMAGTVVGTPEYMAPERLKSSTPNPSSDLYSLGVLAYEMLSGALPFPGPEPLDYLRQHVKLAPRPLAEAAPHLEDQGRLCALVMKCLEKNPKDRPVSAEALAAQFLSLPSIGEPTILSETLAPILSLEAADSEATHLVSLPPSEAAKPPVLPGSARARRRDPELPRIEVNEASPHADVLGDTVIRPQAPLEAEADRTLLNQTLSPRLEARPGGSEVETDPPTLGFGVPLPASAAPRSVLRTETSPSVSAVPSLGAVLRKLLGGAALVLGLILAMAGLKWLLRDTSYAEVRAELEAQKYKEALARIEPKLEQSQGAARKKWEGLKSVALHGLGRHKEERRLQLGLGGEAPSWQEPLVLGALVEDLGNRYEPELRALLDSLPRVETHELLESFMDGAAVPTAKHWAALRHLDRNKALDDDTLRREYLRALDAQACGVKAASATRLGELLAMEAKEALLAVRRAKTNAPCAQTEAAQALRKLESAVSLAE